MKKPYLDHLYVKMNHYLDNANTRFIILGLLRHFTRGGISYPLESEFKIPFFYIKTVLDEKKHKGQRVINEIKVGKIRFARNGIWSYTGELKYVPKGYNKWGEKI